jgi:hypothetical protein
MGKIMPQYIFLSEGWMVRITGIALSGGRFFSRRIGRGYMQHAGCGRKETKHCEQLAEPHDNTKKVLGYCWYCSNFIKHDEDAVYEGIVDNTFTRPRAR